MLSDAGVRSALQALQMPKVQADFINNAKVREGLIEKCDISLEKIEESEGQSDSSKKEKIKQVSPTDALVENAGQMQEAL